MPTTPTLNPTYPVNYDSVTGVLIQPPGAAVAPAGGGFTTGQQPGITSSVVAATAGNVGEILTIAQGPVALVSNTPTTIATLSLTPGDWDVWGVYQLILAAGGLLGAYSVGINTVTNTLPAGYANTVTLTGVTYGANVTITIPSINTTELITATSNVFAVANVNFSAGTCNANATIFARRRR